MQEIEELNALVESMAITEFNLHGADHKDQAKGKKPQMLQM